MKGNVRTLVSIALVLLLAVPVIVSSAGESQGQPAKESKAKMKMPGASGKELWDYLQDAKYRKSFKLWPGKGKLYKGTEPHGMLLTTYVNKHALGAINGKKGTLPAGAIIVKENYSPEKKLMAYTVMYKVDKFNPEANDWFWAKYAPDGKVEAEGKVEMCIGCHGKEKGNDYIFTGKLR